MVSQKVMTYAGYMGPVIIMRVTSRHHDRATRLLHLCNRGLTATKTALTAHYHLFHHATEKSTVEGWYSGLPAVCRSATDSGTSHASYGVVDGTCQKKISDEAVETGRFLLTSPVSPFFAEMVDVTLTDIVGTAWTMLREGYWRVSCYCLRKHYSWCKITIKWTILQQ